jgi:hypothetical protein
MLCVKFTTRKPGPYSDSKISLTEGFLFNIFYLNQEKKSSKENLSLLLEEANNKLYEFYIIIFNNRFFFFVKHKDIYEAQIKITQL